MRMGHLSQLTSFLLIIVGATIASASGTTVGDGGHGVICPLPGRRAFIEPLDFYEARANWQIIPSLANSLLPTGVGIEARIFEAERRFQEIGVAAPEVLERLEYAITLANNVRLTYLMPKTSDTGPFPKIAANCRLAQLGVRVKFDAQEFISFYGPYWNRMSEDAKAALLIHESLHLDFSGPDTRAIRQLIGYLAAPHDFRIRNRALIETILRTRTAVDPSLFR